MTQNRGFTCYPFLEKLIRFVTLLAKVINYRIQVHMYADMRDLLVRLLLGHSAVTMSWWKIHLLSFAFILISPFQSNKSPIFKNATFSLKIHIYFRFLLYQIVLHLRIAMKSLRSFERQASIWHQDKACLQTRNLHLDTDEEKMCIWD